MGFIFDFILRFGVIEFVSAFFVSINMFTFFLYALDKRKAVKNKWRIREGVLVFFTIAGGGLGAWLGMVIFRHKTRKKKFRFAAAVGLIITFVFVIHVAHGLTLGRIIRFVEIEFYSENWPSHLDGYRIAFATDFHIITDEAMRRAAAELNTRNIDLLLLGGDFSMGGSHYQGTLREIAQINAADGIFGVDGNHDDFARLFWQKSSTGYRLWTTEDCM